MTRDLKKENEWRKNKYKRFVVDIDKKTSEKFTEALKSSGKTYSCWVKENIEIFLKNFWKDIDVRVHVCYNIDNGREINP